MQASLKDEEQESLPDGVSHTERDLGDGNRAEQVFTLENIPAKEIGLYDFKLFIEDPVQPDKEKLECHMTLEIESGFSFNASAFDRAAFYFDLFSDPGPIPCDEEWRYELPEVLKIPSSNHTRYRLEFNAGSLSDVMTLDKQELVLTIEKGVIREKHLGYHSLYFKLVDEANLKNDYSMIVYVLCPDDVALLKEEEQFLDSEDPPLPYISHINSFGKV